MFDATISFELEDATLSGTLIRLLDMMGLRLLFFRKPGILLKRIYGKLSNILMLVVFSQKR